MSDHAASGLERIAKICAVAQDSVALRRALLDAIRTVVRSTRTCG